VAGSYPCRPDLRQENQRLQAELDALRAELRKRGNGK
jgi:hypothetical protein